MMARSGLHCKLRDGKELGGEGWLTEIQAPQILALPFGLFDPWAWVDFLTFLGLSFFIFKIRKVKLGNPSLSTLPS